MKNIDAQRVMETGKWPGSGFMISFEVDMGSCYHGDWFPDKHSGENLIPSEDEVWAIAEKFSESTKGKTVNIYVVDQNFDPVVGYKEKAFRYLSLSGKRLNRRGW